MLRIAVTLKIGEEEERTRWKQRTRDV